MRWSLYEPACLGLPQNSQTVRLPMERRSLGGLRRSSSPEDHKNFDQRWILHDVFLDEEGVALRAVGPPLRNLATGLPPLRATLQSSRTPLVHRISTKRRVAFHQWDLPREFRGRDKLEVNFTLGDLVQKTLVARRSTLKTVDIQWTTIQKDNPPGWATDWIRYHESLGVDRFLIYDNGSSNRAELEHALEHLESESEAVLVHWPFPYGPMASRKNRFCQPSQNNHAHLCFGQTEWTGHFDLDEYLVLQQGGSLKDFVASAHWPHALLRFDSYWVPSVAGTPSAERTDTLPTVRDFPYRERKSRRKAHKYMVREDQLCVAETHNATVAPGWRRRAIGTETAAFLHYRALTTEWRENVIRGRCVDFDETKHIADAAVALAMERLDRSSPARSRPRTPS